LDSTIWHQVALCTWAAIDTQVPTSSIRSESRGPSCSSERPQLSIQHLQPHPRPANPPTCPSTRIQPSQCLPPGKPPVSRTLRSAAIGAPDTAIDTSNSYNRYIAVASRVVRRSLKEEARIVAERRGVSELRFAKWEVSRQRGEALDDTGRWRLTMDRTASRAKSRN
jgi:hypothetical protein